MVGSSAGGTGSTTAVKSQAAQLLDCSESEVAEKTAEFKITSVALVDGEWVVKVTGDRSHGDKYGNGYVRITQVTIPGAPAGSAFFKAELVESLDD